MDLANLRHRAFKPVRLNVVRHHRRLNIEVVTVETRREEFVRGVDEDEAHCEGLPAGDLDPLWWTPDSGVRPEEGALVGASIEVPAGVPA
jgi:hypothetical protein